MTREPEKTCCFTGHRSLCAADRALLPEKIRQCVIECIDEGYTCFLAGGALGFDTLAAEAVLDLKKEFPFLRLVLAIPYPDQAKGWSEKDRARYEGIKAAADEVVCLSDSYRAGCMQKRNRYLVDQSSLCIAYLRQDSGGTAYTVRYANQNGVPVLRL